MGTCEALRAAPDGTSAALGQAATAMRCPSPKGSNSLALGNAQGRMGARGLNALKAHESHWSAARYPISPRRDVAPSVRGWPLGWFVFMGRCPMLHCLGPSGRLPLLFTPFCSERLVGHGQVKPAGFPSLLHPPVDASHTDHGTRPWVPGQPAAREGSWTRWPHSLCGYLNTRYRISFDVVQ